MKQKKEILAELYEKESQYGNTYYHGKLDGGQKLYMQKVKGKAGINGEPVWQIMIGN